MDSNFLIQSLEWIQTKWNDYISPIVLLRKYEGGVILKWGDYGRTMKTGINFKWPYPINESHKCLVKPETIETRPFTVTTKDNIPVVMTLIGCYIINDPHKWITEANDAGSNLYHHMIAIGSDYITDMDWSELKDKTSYTPIKKKLNKEVDYLGANFILLGYGSICKTLAVSLINH